jgi:UMF1 family MFS transporter
MQQDSKKAIFGWAMYDWANSAFATTIIAVFFPIFFKTYWGQGVDTNTSTAGLGVANSIAGLVIAILAPIIGAIADRGSAKKRFLVFFACIGIVMTASLFWVAQGQWMLAIAVYVIASVGFEGSVVFYDALIVGVASEKKMDMVSALGYSFGYLGGGLLLAINVWMALQPAAFGFENATEAGRFAILSVGVWWVVFSIPLLLFVKEARNPDAVSGMVAVKAGLHQLRETFREIRHLKTIFLFLLAYWLYIDGVHTVVRMAMDYGLSLGFEQNDLIIALLITQFVGFPAAIGFGYLGGKFGAKRGIFVAITVYIGVSVLGAFMQNARHFYLLAITVGLVQGGVQALSRSLYAKIIPTDKSAEYFGFYNMLGKFAAVLGPSLMGGVGLLIRSFGSSSQLASRLSITSVSILFVAGGVLLYYVDVEQAKANKEHLV